MREHTSERTYIAYPSIREADMLHSKKLLRVLELREKINHSLYYPLNSIIYPGGVGLQPQRARINLLTLLFEVGVQGKTYDLITAKETDVRGKIFPVFEANKNKDLFVWYTHPVPEDDSITRQSILGYLAEVQIEQEDGSYLPEMRPTALDKSDYGVMDQLWIIEEWFFDRQRSVMDVRIVAMMPKGVISDKTIWGFWICYNDYRELLSKYEVFNTMNDAEHKTFDDIFFKRRFSSYIIAESNNYDNRLITDYLLGIEAVREGERIQDKLFKYEHDQWEY